MKYKGSLPRVWANLVIESARRPRGCLHGQRHVVALEMADAVLVERPDELKQVNDAVVQLNAAARRE